jgi:excisionase family DNA binding protein
MEGNRDQINGTITMTEATVKALLLTPRQAAIALAISTRKLWTLTNCREVPCVRIGRLVRYDPSDLRKWIDDQKRLAL